MRYAGYIYDQGTGLYYLRARWYAPGIGRFLTRDPFEGVTDDPLTLNRYAYAIGNPVLYVDPDGNHVQLAVLYIIVGILTVKSLYRLSWYNTYSGQTYLTRKFGYWLRDNFRDVFDVIDRRARHRHDKGFLWIGHRRVDLLRTSGQRTRALWVRWFIGYIWWDVVSFTAFQWL